MSEMPNIRSAIDGYNTSASTPSEAISPMRALES